MDSLVDDSIDILGSVDSRDASIQRFQEEISKDKKRSKYIGFEVAKSGSIRWGWKANGKEKLSCHNFFRALINDECSKVKRPRLCIGNIGCPEMYETCHKFRDFVNTFLDQQTDIIYEIIERTEPICLPLIMAHTSSDPMSNVIMYEIFYKKFCGNEETDTEISESEAFLPGFIDPFNESLPVSISDGDGDDFSLMSSLLDIGDIELFEGMSDMEDDSYTVTPTMSAECEDAKRRIERIQEAADCPSTKRLRKDWAYYEKLFELRKGDWCAPGCVVGIFEDGCVGPLQAGKLPQYYRVCTADPSELEAKLNVHCQVAVVGSGECPIKLHNHEYQKFKDIDTGVLVSEKRPAGSIMYVYIKNQHEVRITRRRDKPNIIAKVEKGQTYAEHNIIGDDGTVHVRAGYPYFQSDQVREGCPSFGYPVEGVRAIIMDDFKSTPTVDRRTNSFVKSFNYLCKFVEDSIPVRLKEPPAPTAVTDEISLFFKRISRPIKKTVKKQLK